MASPRIIVVEYPRSVPPEKLARRAKADPRTAQRACPACGTMMGINPNDEIKTCSPPLYKFRCACGHSEFSRHPAEEFPGTFRGVPIQHVPDISQQRILLPPENP